MLDLMDVKWQLVRSRPPIKCTEKGRHTWTTEGGSGQLV